MSNCVCIYYVLLMFPDVQHDTLFSLVSGFKLQSIKSTDALWPYKLVSDKLPATPPVS